MSRIVLACPAPARAFVAEGPGVAVSRVPSGAAQVADPALPLVWPEPETVAGVEGEVLTIPGSTPLTLSDVGDPDDAPPRDARVSLFLNAALHAA
ncbi:MAG: hypothetical protein GDA49_12960 [Rhodospirillales bacterium]|nr:hypothetical protein [Rhodospirillales bacterium]